MNSIHLRSRRTLGAAAATAIALLLAGCGSSSGSGSGAGGGSSSKTIHLLMQTGQPQQSVLDGLAKKFEAANPGTTVTTEYVDPATYAQVLLTRLRSGSGPDLFYANGGTGQTYSLGPLVKDQKILDLTGQPWVSTIPSDATSLYTFAGKTYGLPLALVPIGIAYNKGAFATLGLTTPTDVPTFLADCQKARGAGKWMLSVAGAAGPNAGIFAQLIAASTVYAHDPDWNAKRAAGTVTFAGSADWVTTLQRIVTLNKAGCIQAGAEGEQIPALFSAVSSEKALSLAGPSGVIQAVIGANKSLTMDLIPFPGTTAADTRAMVAYSDAMAVNAGTKAKDTALKFLDFMAVPANAAAFADSAGSVSLPDAKTGTLPSTTAGFVDYVKGQRTAALPNQSFINGDVYAALSTGVQGLITGQQTPADVLAAMDTAWDKGAS